MSFRTKILAALAVIGVAPLVLMGWLSFRTSRQELESTVGALQAQRAVELVRFGTEVTTDIVASLRLSASYIPFQSLTPGEITDVLRIPYQQFPLINVIAVFDEKGRAVANPVYRRPDDTDAEASAHEEVTPEQLQTFVKNVPPLGTVLELGAAIGPPYGGEAGARVAVGVRLSGDPIRVMIAEISLRQLGARLAELATEGQLAWVVDGAGEPFVAGDVAEAFGGGERGLIAELQGPGAPLVRELNRDDGSTWLAAAAVVPELGWSVLVQMPTAVAFAASRRLALYTALWAAVVVVLLAAIGFPLSRSLIAPIRTLAASVDALARGRYDRPVAIQSRDEIGRFAETFNQMATAITERDTEIRGWNQELRQRVEERTRELEQAQEQIRRSERMTSLGTLGAGVAHELNNPLTGIVTLLPLVQRGLRDRPDASELIDVAITHANRVAKIVADFRGFVDREGAPTGTPVSPLRITKSVLAARADDLTAASVRLTMHHSESIPDILANATEMEQALDRLVANAIEAMAEGGLLSVEVASVGDKAARIVVRDTGCGISSGAIERIFDPFFSDKATSKGAGLGLSVAHNIIDQHGGTIAAESVEGEGSTFTITLPAASAAAHLE